MGLMDIINEMQGGPNNQAQPGHSGNGGMSPMTIALVGLLVQKALKSFSGNAAAEGATQGQTQGAGANNGGGLGDILGGLLGPQQNPGAASAGGLGDLFRSGLGGLFGGASAGSVVSGGLGNLLNDLERSGQGQAAQSWVGTGPNKNIPPGDLESAIGSDTLDALAKHTGMRQDDLLQGLSKQLPGLVDKLTPHGRLPTEREAQQMV